MLKMLKMLLLINTILASKFSGLAILLAIFLILVGMIIYMISKDIER